MSSLVRIAFPVLAVLAVFCLIPVAAGHSRAVAGSDSPRAATVRVGTYDSRAVAIAYVRSEASAAKLRELLHERAEAEKNGQAKRIKELNARGEALQLRRHLQGFSNAPIDDILDTIRNELPAIAAKRNVKIITRELDYHDPAVERIDVTDDLVQLFKPDDQTRKMLDDLRKRKPEPIEEVARHGPNG